jgi:serine/threonine-protein kinase HipA
VFEYEPAFVRTGIELAPLTMPLARAREPFVFTDLPELTFKRLPTLLADALPDAFGNALIDGWMAAQGVERESITALDRLAYMGRRGMGALEFKPANASVTNVVRSACQSRTLAARCPRSRVA